MNQFNNLPMINQCVACKLVIFSVLFMNISASQDIRDLYAFCKRRLRLFSSLGGVTACGSTKPHLLDTKKKNKKRQNTSIL